MRCLCCDYITTNSSLPCPNCGYKFDVDTDMYCPNSSFGKCQITNSLCTKGINFSTCPIKAKADSESF